MRGWPTDAQGARLRYYDLKRHWTKRIEPHLGDAELNRVLVRDFNKYTFGRWRERFRRGDDPFAFESCDWFLDHRGRHPRFWLYVKHAACHWLVNFNLRLAQLAEPGRPWRIRSSDYHSTVWDGAVTLFDLNFSAFGVSPEECFQLSAGRCLPVGKYLRVYFAQHHSEESRVTPPWWAPAQPDPGDALVPSLGTGLTRTGPMSG